MKSNALLLSWRRMKHTVDSDKAETARDTRHICWTRDTPNSSNRTVYCLCYATPPAAAILCPDKLLYIGCTRCSCTLVCHVRVLLAATAQLCTQSLSAQTMWQRGFQDWHVTARTLSLLALLNQYFFGLQRHWNNRFCSYNSKVTWLWSMFKISDLASQLAS